MKNVNIAIGRLYGSSGRKIAEKLAKELGIRLYDRQIICLLAERLGLEKANIEDINRLLDTYNYQERQGMGFYSYSTPGAAGDYSDIQMFVEQSKIIRNLAQSEPGVFLGRCANVVLKDIPHSYSFFLYASEEYRRQEIQTNYQDYTKKGIKKRDKLRDEYYKRFTGFKREDPSQYDLIINVEKTGIDEAVRLIIAYLEEKEKETKSK